LTRLMMRSAFGTRLRVIDGDTRIAARAGLKLK
jgi:hypothetical protein